MILYDIFATQNNSQQLKLFLKILSYLYIYYLSSIEATLLSSDPETCIKRHCWLIFFIPGLLWVSCGCCECITAQVVTHLCSPLCGSSRARVKYVKMLRCQANIGHVLFPPPQRVIPHVSAVYKSAGVLRGKRCWDQSEHKKKVWS